MTSSSFTRDPDPEGPSAQEVATGSGRSYWTEDEVAYIADQDCLFILEALTARNEDSSMQPLNPYELRPLLAKLHQHELCNILDPPLMALDWTIQVGASGDEAQARTLNGALLAADEMCHDHANYLATMGALRIARASVLITYRGMYDGNATGLARSASQRRI